MPVPSFDNCYWVEPGRFLAGEYPGHRDDSVAQTRLAALVQAGVGVFIDLTSEADHLRPYAPLLAAPADRQLAHYQRFPIRDVSTPHAPEFTRGILDAIDAHLADGRMVYLHCWGGVGRTGLIVGCWLARHGHPGAAALARLHELWRRCPKSLTRSSPETWEQEQYILDWREEIG